MACSDPGYEDLKFFPSFSAFYKVGSISTVSLHLSLANLVHRAAIVQVEN